MGERVIMKRDLLLLVNVLVCWGSCWAVEPCAGEPLRDCETAIHNRGWDTERHGSTRHHRGVRDSPFGPPATCTISVEELVDLAEVIRHMTSPSPSTPPSRTTSVAGTSSQCPQVEEIKQGILDLKVVFSSLRSRTARLSDAEFNEKKSDAEDRIRKLKTDMDVLTRASRAEHNAQLNTINTRFQELSGNMTRTVATLEQERVAHSVTKTRLCIKEITSNNIDFAAQLFTELGVKRNLTWIVRDAYMFESNFENNTKQILDFILKFPSHFQLESVVAFETLFNEVSRNSHLESPQILLIHFYVEKYLESNAALIQPYSHRLLNITRSLEPKVQRVLASWGRRIRNGDNKYQFLNKEFTTVFDKYLKMLVHYAFEGHITNFKNVTDFLMERKVISSYVIGFHAVFDELESNNHFSSNEMQRLALLIRSVMQHESYDRIPHKNKQSFELLRNRFSGCLRAVVWNNVYIKNVIHNEYIMRLDPKSSHRSYVRLNSERRPDSVWSFELVSSQDPPLEFKIKNVRYQEYLRANPGLFVSRSQTFKWNLVSLSSGNTCNLRNVGSGAFLHPRDVERYPVPRHRPFFVSQNHFSATHSFVDWEIIGAA